MTETVKLFYSFSPTNVRLEEFSVIARLICF
jgi:hypothetical protein